MNTRSIGKDQPLLFRFKKRIDRFLCVLMRACHDGRKDGCHSVGEMIVARRSDLIGGGKIKSISLRSMRVRINKAGRDVFSCEVISLIREKLGACDILDDSVFHVNVAVEKLFSDNDFITLDSNHFILKSPLFLQRHP